MRLALAPWLAVALATTACHGKKSTPVSPGNTVLEITELLPRDNDVWLAPREADPVTGDDGYPGDPGPVTIGCDLRLGVQATVENFYLRAPDACAGNIQCGVLLVELLRSDSATVVASGRAATTSVVLDLCGLAATDEGVPGSYVLRPSLVLPDGSTYASPYAFTPEDVDVTLAEDACNGLPPRCSGGSTAGNFPEETGGAPNETSAGGAGGTSETSAGGANDGQNP
ncbi:MAG TPA: hypothetical protein VMI54_16360 [Polyangiaceae bacterium]|nr:hypothetical protein [Polyangiaceae bacterium]